MNDCKYKQNNENILREIQKNYCKICKNKVSYI